MGANASYMSWDPEYARAGHVVVHHTAGTNSYSAGQSASIVRGIYYYHAVTLDWATSATTSSSTSTAPSLKDAPAPWLLPLAR